MPTLEGIVFIPVALFFFFFRPRLLFPLLIVSTVFEASSVISSGSIGIQPYYCVAILFVLRALIDKGKVPGQASDRYFRWLWIAFAFVATISAIILPIAFGGIPVFSGRLGIDENFLSGGVPLHLQSGNLIQPAFLILNILVVFSAAKQGQYTDAAHKAFIGSAYLIIFIVLLQVLFFWAGLPFPITLINNNPGYSVVDLLAGGSLRPSGSFTEPSTLGAVLAALFAAFLWRYLARKSSLLSAALTALACLLAASSSSFAAVAIVVIILVLTQPIVRLPWYIRISRLKRFSAIFGSVILLALLMLIPTIRSLILAQTIEKSASSSALARLGADAYAFTLVGRTYGLGVGLGSNRPSSFVAALLSQVGVIGILLFACAAWSTLRNLPRSDRWIGMALLGLLLSMAFGLPDLSFPYLWVLFALAAQSKAADSLLSQSASPSHAGSESQSAGNERTLFSSNEGTAS
jgi:hypothetical protein